MNVPTAEQQLPMLTMTVANTNYSKADGTSSVPIGCQPKYLIDREKIKITV